MHSTSRTINLFFRMLVCLYGNFSTANNNTSTMNTLLTSMVQWVKGYVKESQDRSKQVKAYQWAGQQKKLSAGDLERCKVLIGIQHELLMLQITGAQDQHNNMIHSREKIISGAERPDNIIEILGSLQANEPKLDLYVHSIGNARDKYFEQFLKEFKLQKKDEIAKILGDPNLTEKTRKELEQRIDFELYSMASDRINTSLIRIEDFIKDRREWYLNCLQALGKASKAGNDRALLQSIKLDQQKERKIRSYEYKVSSYKKNAEKALSDIEAIQDKVIQEQLNIIFKNVYGDSYDSFKKDNKLVGVAEFASETDINKSLKIKKVQLLKEGGIAAAEGTEAKELNAKAQKLIKFKEVYDTYTQPVLNRYFAKLRCHEEKRKLYNDKMASQIEKNTTDIRKNIKLYSFPCTKYVDIFADSKIEKGIHSLGTWYLNANTAPVKLLQIDAQYSKIVSESFSLLSYANVEGKFLSLKPLLKNDPEKKEN